MSFTRTLYSCFIFLLIYGTVLAQDAYSSLADSIYRLVEEEPDEREKIRVIFDNVFYYDFAPFTFDLITQANEISNRLGDESLIIESLLSYGQFYNFSSKYDSSQVFFDEALALPFLEKHVAFKAELLEAKAVAFSRSNKIQEAINYLSLIHI